MCAFRVKNIHVTFSQIRSRELVLTHHPRIRLYVYVIYYIIFWYCVTCDTCVLMETVICIPPPQNAFYGGARRENGKKIKEICMIRMNGEKSFIAVVFFPCD